MNATRDIETPALDQFDVPANAAGGSIVWSAAAGSEHQLTLGGDARWVEGETNENFSLERHGIHASAQGRRRPVLCRRLCRRHVVRFFEHDNRGRPPGRSLGTLRWLRKETVRATGAVLTDSQFADREGNEINGRIGARVKPTEYALAVRRRRFTPASVCRR